MPAFLLYFGEVSPVTHSLFVPSIWTALFSSMSGLCQALGGFFIGFIYERFGRKPSAIGSASLSMAGIAIQYTATTRGSLLAGKMVNCLALGAMMSTGSTYISEVNFSSARYSMIILTIFVLDRSREASRPHAICPRSVPSSYAYDWVGYNQHLPAGYVRVCFQESLCSTMGLVWYRSSHVPISA